MTITLHSSSFSDVMHDLARGLSADLRQHHGEVTIELPAAVGQGTIRAVQFHSRLSLLRLRLRLEESLVLHVTQTDYHPLRRLLCEAGSLTHSVDARHIQYRMLATDCSLSACSGDVDQVFQLPSHQELSLYMVEIDRRRYMQRIRQADGAVHSRIKEVFADTEARFPFLYHSFSNWRSATGRTALPTEKIVIRRSHPATGFHRATLGVGVGAGLGCSGASGCSGEGVGLGRSG